jgi:DNA-binding transcriptional LysR family regulator
VLITSSICDDDGMELRQLEYFVAVADELSFTRAGQRLHVVQSGVSATVKNLERELGVTLFDRSPQLVALTEAGSVFLPHARATLDAARQAAETVSGPAGGLRGALNVGTMTTPGFVEVPVLLGHFHEQHPNVTLRLKTVPSGSAGLADAVLRGSLDVAFLSLTGAPPSGLRWRELATSRIVLVVREDHRLARRPSVGLDELAGETFVDFPVGYGNRTVVDQVFAAERVDRHVAHEVADLTTGAECVAEGLGIAFLPTVAIPDDPRLRVVEVAAPLWWYVGVATATTRRASAALTAFLALVTEHVRIPAASPSRRRPRGRR